MQVTDSGPHHCFSCSGSVQAWKRRSAEAGIVLRITSFASLRLPVSIQCQIFPVAAFSARVSCRDRGHEFPATPMVLSKNPDYLPARAAIRDGGGTGGNRAAV